MPMAKGFYRLQRPVTKIIINGLPVIPRGCLTGITEKNKEKLWGIPKLCSVRSSLITLEKSVQVFATYIQHFG
jgi:hypothetical protein